MQFIAEAYLHRLDPFLIQFTESFGIRWYGVAYAVGFVIAWLWIRWFAVTGRSPMTRRDVGDLMTYVILGVLIGGRLGYALFYDLSLLGFTGSFPFWNLLALHKGGMASHGGILGVIIGCWIFGRRRGIPALHILDIGGLVCSPGLGIGRVANFVNAELPGEPLPAAMQQDPPWWSVKYAEQILPTWPRPFANAAEMPAVEALVAPSTRERVVAAVHEGNQQVIDALQPLLTAHYPSQIFQAITDGLIVTALLMLIWMKPRKPGVMGCWFLIIYSVLRFTTEFFRQGDEGITRYFDINRGQLISILVIIAGAGLMVIFARRDVEKLPGLRG